MKRKDLTNQLVGKLKVLYPDTSNKYKRLHWICRCECGKIYPVRASHLQSESIESCGCFRTPNYKEIPGAYWRVTKFGAKIRNLTFNITMEYAWDLFIQQNRKCLLTGRELKFGIPYSRMRKYQTASLDRIDSNQGYIVGNICWLHKDINMFKGAIHSNSFIQLCYEVVNYQEKLKEGLTLTAEHDKI